MHFLIDADSLIYKAGCANEERRYDIIQGGFVVADFMYKADALEFVGDDETLDIEFVKEAGPLKHALSNTKSLMDRIIKQERCTSYTVYIGGKDNFRYDIDPNYKNKRSKDTKPLQEKEIREYLIKRYGAVVVDGEEVDDRVSYECLSNPETSVIVSIDKDLNNTAGFHFNYDKEQFYYVSPEEADLNFYRQLISGDSIDGIVGIKGAGKGKALSMLPKYMAVDSMCSLVWNMYKEKGYNWKYFITQGQLLWMLREKGVMWQPPIKEKPDGEIEVRGRTKEEDEELSV